MSTASNQSDIQFINDEFKAFGTSFKAALGPPQADSAIDTFLRQIGSSKRSQSDEPPPIHPWQCRIGLSTFIVPPISIQISQQFKTGSLAGSNIREQSTLKYNSGHSETIISLGLYFPTVNSIWGYQGNSTKAPFDVWNDDDATLDTFFGSLRGLIAQFKYAPFVPIRNEYLNQTFNITAVALDSLTVSTVEGFPFCLMARLQMKSFNYQVFLPMINDFNDAVNWGRFRYYVGKGAQLLESAVNKEFLQTNPPVGAQNTPSNTTNRPNPDPILTSNSLSFDFQSDYLNQRQFDFFYPISDPARLYMPTMYGWENNPTQGSTTQNTQGWSGMVESLGLSHTGWSVSFANSYIQTNQNGPPIAFNALKAFVQSNNLGLSEMSNDKLTKFQAQFLAKVGLGANIDQAKLDAQNAWMAMLFKGSTGNNSAFENLVNLQQYIKGQYMIDEWEVPMAPLGLDPAKVFVQGVSVTLGNAFADLQLQFQSSPTYQHIGGKDTRYDISLLVQGESELLKIRRMWEIINNYAMLEHGHAVLGFLGVKNPVSAVCGSKYALPLSFDVDTIPGVPHAYKVNISLLDFDILQQTREILSSAQQQDLIDAFGKANPFLRIKQFWQIVNTYPDKPLSIYDNEGKVLGVLDPDFYFKSFYAYDDDVLALHHQNEADKDSGRLEVSLGKTSEDNSPDGQHIHIHPDGVDLYEGQKPYMSGLKWNECHAGQVLLKPTVPGLKPFAEYQQPYVDGSGDPTLQFEYMLADQKYRDKTGRLIRAFPTYMLWLVDEGGVWGPVRLFENFYGLQSVIDFSLVQSQNCFSGDTRVVTRYGVKTLQELSNTNPILMTSSGWERSEVRSFGPQPLRKVTLSRQGGRTKIIHATPDHSWRVLRFRNENSSRIAVSTDDLKPGMWMSEVYGHTSKNLNISLAGIQHGLIFGDGCVPKDDFGFGTANIRLCGEKNLQLIEYFGGYPTRAIEEDVEVSGLPRRFKLYPDLTEDRSYLLGWLAGYFAADGCVDKEGQPFLDSCDRSHLEYVREVCYLLGIGTYAVATIERVSNLTGKSSTLYRLPLLRHTIQNDFFLIDQHRMRFAAQEVKKEPRWRVISVEETDRVEEVFCAIVPKSHEFVLEDNILTGNCIGDTLILRVSNVYQRLTTPYSQYLDPAIFGDAALLLNTQLNIKRNTLSDFTDYVVDLQSIQLKPGTRIHLRAGYSANPCNLPTLFNGTITQVTTGDIMTIEAQSDSVELTSIINGTNPKGNSAGIDSSLTGLYMSEPRDIMVRLLSMTSSVLTDTIAAASRGLLYSNNKYGIRHFGRILYDAMPNEGQNSNGVINWVSRFTSGPIGAAESLVNTGAGGTDTLPIIGPAFHLVNQVFATTSSTRDLELYRRNIYPGNGCGIAQYLGGDVGDGGLAVGFLSTGIDPSTGGADQMLPPTSQTNTLTLQSAVLNNTKGSSQTMPMNGFVAGLSSVSGGTLNHFVHPLLSILHITHEQGAGSGIPNELNDFSEVTFRASTYMKSVWDIFLTCAALLPNYIVAVRPFEDRSTVFYGKPHWLWTSAVLPLSYGPPKPLPVVDVDQTLQTLLNQLDLVKPQTPQEWLDSLNSVSTYVPPADAASSSGAISPGTYTGGAVVPWNGANPLTLPLSHAGGATIPQRIGGLNIEMHLPVSVNGGGTSNLQTDIAAHIQQSSLPPQYQHPFYMDRSETGTGSGPQGGVGGVNRDNTFDPKKAGIDQTEIQGDDPHWPGRAGAFGILKATDEEFYINMRWGDGHYNPDEYRNRRILVYRADTKQGVICTPGDYGPSSSTGLIAGVSPEAYFALGAPGTNVQFNFGFVDDSMSLGPVNFASTGSTSKTATAVSTSTTNNSVADWMNNPADLKRTKDPETYSMVFGFSQPGIPVDFTDPQTGIDETGQKATAFINNFRSEKQANQIWDEFRNFFPTDEKTRAQFAKVFGNSKDPNYVKQYAQAVAGFMEYMWQNGGNRGWIVTTADVATPGTDPGAIDNESSLTGQVSGIVKDVLNPTNIGNDLKTLAAVAGDITGAVHDATSWIPGANSIEGFLGIGNGPGSRQWSFDRAESGFGTYLQDLVTGDTTSNAYGQQSYPQAQSWIDSNQSHGSNEESGAVRGVANVIRDAVDLFKDIVTAAGSLWAAINSMLTMALQGMESTLNMGTSFMKQANALNYTFNDSIYYSGPPGSLPYYADNPFTREFGEPVIEVREPFQRVHSISSFNNILNNGIVENFDNVNCVDEETEIFTEEGWRYYNEIKEGTLVLTLNHETGLSEWQTIDSMNIFHVRNKQMILMEGNNHSSLTTLNHRWPIIRPYGRKRIDTRNWVTTESFKYHDKIILSAFCNDQPIDPKYTDEFVELVAWFWTEGHIKPAIDNPSIAIYQSATYNAANTDRIRAILTKYLGSPQSTLRHGRTFWPEPAWSECPNMSKGGEWEFRFNWTASIPFLEVAPDKVVRPAFLRQLTLSQLELFIKVSMLGDNDGLYKLSQRNKEMCESFQFACVLAGFPTSFRSTNRPRTQKHRKGDPNDHRMWGSAFLSRGYLKPIESLAQSKSAAPSKNIYPRTNKRFAINEILYTGIIWCPSTENKTWLARRKGSVYFTGNTLVTATSNGENPVTVYFDRGAPGQFQKEMDVDTGLFWNKPGLFSWLNPVKDLRYFKSAWNGDSDTTSAQRVALWYLKESLKNIYGGEILVIGDPDIRPFDLVDIYDSYQSVYGLAEVAQVVHHFTPETGFITSITPNALVTINDPARWSLMYQLKHANMTNQIRQQLKRVYASPTFASYSDSDTTSVQNVVSNIDSAITNHIQYTGGLSSLVKDMTGHIATGSLLLGGAGAASVAPAAIPAAAAAAGIGTATLSGLGIVGGLIGWKAWGFVKNHLLDQHGCYISYLTKAGGPMDAGLQYNTGVAVGSQRVTTLLNNILLPIRITDGNSIISVQDLLSALGWNEQGLTDQQQSSSYTAKNIQAQLLNMQNRQPTGAGTTLPGGKLAVIYLVTVTQILSGNSFSIAESIAPNGVHIEGIIPNSRIIGGSIVDPVTYLQDILMVTTPQATQPTVALRVDPTNPNSATGQLSAFVFINAGVDLAQAQKNIALVTNAGATVSSGTDLLPGTVISGSGGGVSWDAYQSSGDPYTLNWQMIQDGFATLDPAIYQNNTTAVVNGGRP